MINSEEIQIRVKLIDDRIFEVKVLPRHSILEIKEQLAVLTDIPTNRQRIIYQGKLLKDHETANELALSVDTTLHLVMNNPTSPEPRSPPSSSTEAAIQRANAAANRRRRRVLRRHEQENVERQETIRQNLATIESLCNTMTPHGFDFRQRQFEIGQWVDVKDTVDQWLEAQIIGLRETSEGPQVYVHYNGWPDRWDEWMNTNSDRILPIHTKTSQHLISAMSGPHPTVRPDAESIPRRTNHNFNDYVQSTVSSLENTKSMLEQYYFLCRDKKPEEEEEKVKKEAEENEEMTQELDTMSTQLVPILDRTGRLMIDLAHVIKPVGAVSQGQVNVPTMPTPRELALMNPRSLSSTEVHVYNLNPDRESGQQVTQIPTPPTSGCGNQLS